MIEKWSCQKHQNQPITFVCTGNIWHFQPLCNICVPDHTKNHPKNIKVQMESIKQVMKKSQEIKQKVSNIYEERLKKCQILKNVTNAEFAYVKCLNQKRQSLIKQINICFDGLLSELSKKRSQQQIIQKDNMIKLIDTLQKNITFLKKAEYPNAGEFCKQIKKYYLKEDMLVYVQEIDQMISQYEQKMIKYNQIVWIKDIQLKTKLFFKDIHRIDKESDNKDKIAEKQEGNIKKQSKKIPLGRKKCGKCKEEMQYLTEWKKHLVCRNCGQKERNYVKKQK